MAVRVKKNESRLRHATLASIDDVEFWSRPVLSDIPISTRDKYHNVEREDRIDILAKKYYKNERLWWVIAHANDLRLLPCSLITGQKLRIPDPKKVRKLLLV